MSLKFGLGVTKKGLNSNGKRAATKTSLAFGDDALDEEQSPAPPLDGTKSKKPKAMMPQFGDLSSQKNFRKNVDNALEVDPSIYDYDAAYDAIQAGAEAKKAAEREKGRDWRVKIYEKIFWRRRT